jgi:hypothetical protein
MSVLKRARWPIIICLARVNSMIVSPRWNVEASNVCIGQDDPSNCLVWIQAECRSSNVCQAYVPPRACDGHGCCEGGPYPTNWWVYPGAWACCQQIVIANPGTLSSLSATTCVGSSVSLPGISETVVSNGFECVILTFDCPSHPSITITNECCYSMTNWWVPSPPDAPMPPAVYTSPGTYSYTAKVKALVDDCYWDDDYLPLCPDSAEATVGTFAVYVKPYECSNPAPCCPYEIFECYHYSNQVPCFATSVIVNQIDTMTCEHDTNGCGTACFLREDPDCAPEITQTWIRSPCYEGSTTNSIFLALEEWWDECESCRSFNITGACETTNRTWNANDVIDTFYQRIKKVACPQP